MLKRLVKKAKDGSGFQSNGKGSKGRDEEAVSDGRQASLNNLLKNGYGQQEYGTSPPRQSVDRCFSTLFHSSSQQGKRPHFKAQ